MAKLLMIDGNAVGYAHQFAHTLVANGMEVQAIMGIVRTIAKQRREKPEHFPMVLWDGRAEWRYKLYPDYKSGRKKSEKSRAAREAYNKQLPYMRMLLTSLGLTQLNAPYAEADDIGYQLTRVLVADGHEVEQLTGDTDWLQNLDRGVSWHDPKLDRRAATPEEMAAIVGTGNRFEYLQAKALVGDSSDSIEGIDGIGEKTAPKILAEFGSVEGFFARVDSGTFTPQKKVHANLASPEGRAVYRRNMRLIDLSQAPVLTPESVTMTASRVSMSDFYELAKQFEFKQMLDNLDATLAPFLDLENRSEGRHIAAAIDRLGEDVEEEEIV